MRKKRRHHSVEHEGGCCCALVRHSPLSSGRIIHTSGSTNKFQQQKATAGTVRTLRRKAASSSGQRGSRELLQSPATIVAAGWAHVLRCVRRAKEAADAHHPHRHTVKPVGWKAHLEPSLCLRLDLWRRLRVPVGMPLHRPGLRSEAVGSKASEMVGVRSSAAGHGWPWLAQGVPPRGVTAPPVCVRARVWQLRTLYAVLISPAVAVLLQPCKRTSRLSDQSRAMLPPQAITAVRDHRTRHSATPRKGRRATERRREEKHGDGRRGLRARRP